MMRRNTESRRQSGFSLLEMLVAFAIMAMSLGLIYRVAGGSARNVTDAAQAQQAAWLAESLLNTHNSLLEDGWNEDGKKAGFTWQVRSTPYNSGINAPLTVPMHEIRIAIQWTLGSRPGELKLVTLLPQRKRDPGEVVR